MKKKEEDIRFQFGKNWMAFADGLDKRAVQRAEKSLKRWLGTEDFSGRNFLDVGCGSGIFSLAAWNLGGGYSPLTLIWTA